MRFPPITLAILSGVALVTPAPTDPSSCIPADCPYSVERYNSLRETRPEHGWEAENWSDHTSEDGSYWFANTQSYEMHAVDAGHRCCETPCGRDKSDGHIQDIRRRRSEPPRPPNWDSEFRLREIARQGDREVGRDGGGGGEGGLLEQRERERERERRQRERERREGQLQRPLRPQPIPTPPMPTRRRRITSVQHAPLQQSPHTQQLSQRPRPRPRPLPQQRFSATTPTTTTPNTAHPANSSPSPPPRQGA